MKKTIIILLALILIGCGQCPESCDDNDACTFDSCGIASLYECTHEQIPECVETPPQQPEFNPQDTEATEQAMLNTTEKTLEATDDGLIEETIDEKATPRDWCTTDMTVPKAEKYAEYKESFAVAEYFIELLPNGEVRQLECFFEPQLSSKKIGEYVNLTKDYYQYQFTYAGTNPKLNILYKDVVDPDFGIHKIGIYMRQDEGVWYIAKIEDPDRILTD